MKKGISTILAVCITVIVMLVLSTGGWYYMDKTAKEAKKASDDRIALLQKNLATSKTETESTQSAVSKETSTEASAATKFQSYDVGISYTSDRKAAIVTNNGVKVGDIPIPNSEIVSILKQTKTNAYLQVRPDGLGGYVLYPMSFPLYKLDLVANTLAKISDSASDVSDSERYIVGTNHSAHIITLLDLSANKTQEFTVESKYAQFGDVKVSPNDKKIAYAASIGNPDNEKGDIFIVTIAGGAQLKVNNYEINRSTKVFGWSTNDDLDWSR